MDDKKKLWHWCWLKKDADSRGIPRVLSADDWEEAKESLLNDIPAAVLRSPKGMHNSPPPHTHIYVCRLELRYRPPCLKSPPPPKKKTH